MSTRIRIIGAALVACALSTTATAAPINVHTEFWGGAGSLDATGIFLDVGLGGDGTAPLFQVGSESVLVSHGAFTFVAPLVATAPGSTPDTTDYTFSAANFVLQASWLDEHGTEQIGTFTALIAEPSLRVDANPGGFQTAERTVALGPGLFDPPLAALLGVAPETFGGALLLRFDIDRLGNPNFPALPYLLWSNQSMLDIDAQSVPEPALLTLLALGVAPLLARRRKR